MNNDVYVLRTCEDNNAGDYGIATAGDYSIANAGDYGIANAGYYGTANVGDYGTANAGIKGIANAGEYGRASAGYGGIILMKYWDINSHRYKIKTGYIGEDGLKPDTLYKIVAGGFVEV